MQINDLPESKTAYRAIPISGTIGAVVDGILIREGIPDSEIAWIHQALTKHRVLFFRNQHAVNDAIHQDFARKFGTIISHPTLNSTADPQILELDSHRGGRANSWHTDLTFTLCPPKLSILRAVQLPIYGGDTVWANTVAAYLHLPRELQALANTLWAVHGNDFDYAASRVELLHDDTARAYRRQYAAQTIKIEHPLVHIHPATGEKSLLLGHYAQRFVNCNTYESDRLYEIFQAHITRLENTIRWTWAPGDVAMWDNMATQHYAINDYGDQKRVMRRVTVVGDTPIACDGTHSRAHSS